MNDIERHLETLVNLTAIEKYEKKTGVKIKNFTDFYERVGSHLNSSQALDEELQSNKFIKRAYQSLGSKIEFLEKKYPTNGNIGLLKEVRQAVNDYSLSKIKIEEYYKKELYEMEQRYLALLDQWVAMIKNMKK